MARKPKPSQPQGDEAAARADVPASPGPEDTATENEPKRTVHPGGIITLDY